MEKSPPSDSWADAARLLAIWLEGRQRIDVLLGSLPSRPDPAHRARCQHLFYGTIRNLGRLEPKLTPLFRKAPRLRVKAILLIAGYELIEGGGEGHVAKVVHHAVGQTKSLASPAEAGLVNAVVRKLAGKLSAESAPGALATAERLAEYYSHPAWLIERWLAQFGARDTRHLLEWNLTVPSVYARWRPADRAPSEAELDCLKPAAWEGFYEVLPNRWSAIEAMLADGRLFVQDPATRHAVALLDPKADEAVLDLCAAPGGKSVSIADRMRRGTLLAVDLSGERQERLEENLKRVPAEVSTSRVGINLCAAWKTLLSRRGDGWPAVMLDVPCSNTGVMRHRVDVKWRLRSDDFARHARRQLALLRAASGLVAKGGRLVYSTCSLENEENQGVVDAFLREEGSRFALAGQILSKPWIDGHDGAGAFLLRRA